jgi:outer membrane protein assembly factor BamB
MTVGTPTIEYSFDVLCIDRNTGAALWQKTATAEKPHEGHHKDHGFASSSPVTDGTHVWAFFGSRGLHCYDMEGNHIWSRDLGDLKTRMSFGEGSSPALAGDNVIVVMDHEGDSFIAALDKKTGDERWRRPRDERTSWTTPLPITHNGHTEVVVCGTNRTRSYNPKTGDILWECGGQTQNAIPTPMTGFGMVFCTSGFRGNALQAIKLGRSGDLTGTDAVAWQLDRNTPYVPSPLLYGDLLYLLSHNKPKLNCVNARTGEELYTNQAIEGIHSVYASPVGAAGRIYIAGRRGKVVVIRHAPEFELLALNTLGEGIDASPAIVGNSLYLRGTASLYCFEK